MNESSGTGRRSFAPAAARAAWCAAGLVGAVGVAAEALAAHGTALFPDPARAAAFRTGADMLLWHAAALFGAGLVAERSPAAGALAASGFLVGILCFAAGVGLHAFAVASGPLAPFGGTVLILSWLALAWAGARASASTRSFARRR